MTVNQEHIDVACHATTLVEETRKALDQSLCERTKVSKLANITQKHPARFALLIVFIPY